MSDAQNQHDHDGPHEGPIRTPKQLILAVFFAIVVPIAVIVLLVEFVTTDHRPLAGTEAQSPDAINARIAPVGMVLVKDASDLTTLKTGEQVFQAQCTTCHTAGALGAPKFGDAEAWAPRIKTGYAALLNSALHGKGNMPAQGGGDYTDFEIGRAVVYMANKGGAKFDEPTPPVAGASAPAAAPAVAAAPAPAMPAAASATAATQVATAAEASPKSDAGAAAVPALYAQVCQACHAAGVAGAPKLGDKTAWAPRIAEAKDIDGLVAVAIKGKGAMPPRGGSTASDQEIKEVVTYMVSQVK